MKLFSRSVLGSLGSVLSPKKGKEKGTGKDQSAPTLPAVGKDISTQSVPGTGSDLPTPSVPDLDKNAPTPSALGTAKDTLTPSAIGADSAVNGNVGSSSVTTSIAVSVTNTITVTSAGVTITTVQHDLTTEVTTVPTTVTTVITTVLPTATAATTLITTSSKQPAVADSTTALPPGTSPISTPRKHIEPAIIISVVFGLIILGLLGITCFLVMRLRRVAKLRPTVGIKTYAEEFDWPQPRSIEMDGTERKDEWGSK